MNSWLKRIISEWLGLDRIHRNLEADNASIERIVNRLNGRRDSRGRFTKG